MRAYIRKYWTEAYVSSRIEILMGLINRVAGISPLIDDHGQAQFTTVHRGEMRMSMCGGWPMCQTSAAASCQAPLPFL